MDLIVRTRPFMRLMKRWDFSCLNDVRSIAKLVAHFCERAK